MAGVLVAKVSEYLVSLPFDLKILQEVVSDPDLDRGVRELAAGTIVHTLLPQEGDLTRFIDDVFFVRAALDRIGADKSEAAVAFRERFTDAYAVLAEDVALFKKELGELWPWLCSKLDSFPKLPFKGKTATQYAADDEASQQLYEEGLEFQTNFNVNEQQVKNKLRRDEQIVEVIAKRHADDLKKKG